MTVVMIPSAAALPRPAMRSPPRHGGGSRVLAPMPIRAQCPDEQSKRDTRCAPRHAPHPQASQEGLSEGRAPSCGEEQRQGKRGYCLIYEIHAVFFLTDETAVASDPLRSAMRRTDAFPRGSGPRLPTTDVGAGDSTAGHGVVYNTAIREGSIVRWTGVSSGEEASPCRFKSLYSAARKPGAPWTACCRQPSSSFRTARWPSPSWMTRASA